MKTLADKIISDKLSSLESLPGDYHPNLDAKWAILSESTVSGRRSYKRWIAIAACLLVATLSYVAWNNINQTQEKVVVQKETVQPSPIVPQTILPAEKTEIKSVAHNPVRKHKEKIQKEIPAEITPVADNENEIASVVNEPAPAPQEQVAVKEKYRFVEMDFNDKVELSNRDETKNNFAIELVRLRSRAKEETPANHDSGVRIRQNF